VTPSSSPRIAFVSFGTAQLEQTLQLTVPPFVQADRALRQLRYVREYAGELGCKSLVVEQNYIDRDYMEDHSVFYSKSLYPYPNFCRRIHFFKEEVERVREQLQKIVEVGIRQGEERFRNTCRDFSDRVYLGFSVIKPLHGSPVGRTVLRCYPEIPQDAADSSRRDFSGTRVYSVHLLGVELSVRGLAFQQQDIGVSACATTAVWSALQKMRDHEDIAPVTPAQITALAAKYSLPFGRAMPSEGLSIDQMCQAVQAVGVSPNVFRADHSSDTRGYLYSALKSGLAPVLILRKGNNYHAVTAVGMKIRLPHEPVVVASLIDDRAGDLIALYVHDDRNGAYLRANLADASGTPTLSLPLRHPTEQAEAWAITHLLVPIHSKIRLSLAVLRELALWIAATMHQIREAIEKHLPTGFIRDSTIAFESWIVRAPQYVESAFVGSQDLSPQRIWDFCERVSMARYLGVVRMKASWFDTMDVLIDTTSTAKNPHILGIFTPRLCLPLTRRVGQRLARESSCEHLC
jgi:hypothetical protein